MKRKDEHKRVAKQERIWAAQAFRDARYNHQQEERAEAQKNLVLAANYRQEVKWDNFWGHRRLRIAMRNMDQSRRR